MQTGEIVELKEYKPEIENGLANLSPRSEVAVITMLGSLCPVTLGHVQAFVEARKMLVDADGPFAFAEAIGFIGLNGDSHVALKLKAKGQSSLCMADRAKLISLATMELQWLSYSPARFHGTVEQLHKRWPHLTFVQYSLNGADDVLRYRKWRSAGPANRFITMGRPGDTERLAEEVQREQQRPDPQYFVLGPELPDISSTAARTALNGLDMDVLARLLHPSVTQWCIVNGAFSNLKA